MIRPASSLCPDHRLDTVRDLLSHDEAAGFEEVGRLLEAHPEDARLHFLHGSLAAGRRDYATARNGLHRAVSLAPGYAIARFQLGLLLLTSGDAVEAEAVLRPLQELGADHALRHFAAGLLFLMQDRFAEAVASLERGLERNHDNPPLNRDMRMLIGEIEARTGMERDDAPLSAAHLLLQQSALKSTKH
jgi:tetratricopeptide (TPR) repeat protein